MEPRGGSAPAPEYPRRTAVRPALKRVEEAAESFIRGHTPQVSAELLEDLSSLLSGSWYDANRDETIAVDSRSLLRASVVGFKLHSLSRFLSTPEVASNGDRA